MQKILQIILLLLVALPARAQFGKSTAFKAASAKTPAAGGGGGGGGGFPSDSIVLNWKLNGDTTDASGNGNDGTAHGTTSYVADETGALNHAISLDGATAYVDANNTTAANFTSGDFAIVMYLTNKAVDFATSPVLWGNTTFSGPGYYFQEHVAFGGDNSAANLIFRFHDGAGDHSITTGDRVVTTVAANYCFVFVRSGTSGKIYMNGTDITLAGQPSIGTIGTSTSKFTVGKYLGGSNFFNGNVQQVIVYSRALTPTEVATGSAGASQ